MPKQSGIHQIRGKRGTTCYYFRKGLQIGLQREINQQMSERVKRDPNFANTRLYASEFGYCGRLAALSFVPSEFGLTLNLRANSQGKLTSIYRNLLNEYGIGNFGKRNFIGTEWQPFFAARINEMSRVALDELYPIKCTIRLVPLATEKRYRVMCTYEWDERLVNKMRQNGIDRLNIVVQHFVLCAGHYSTDAQRYINMGHLGGSFAFEYVLPLTYAEEHTKFTQTISSAIIDYPTDLAQRIEGGDSILARPVIYIEGMRNVNGTLYKQQTKCGFKMLDNSEITSLNPESVRYGGFVLHDGDVGALISAIGGYRIQVTNSAFLAYPNMNTATVTVNGQSASITAVVGDTLLVSFSNALDGQRLTSVNVTYPDGNTGTITFTTPPRP